MTDAVLELIEAARCVCEHDLPRLNAQYPNHIRVLRRINRLARALATVDVRGFITEDDEAVEALAKVFSDAVDATVPTDMGQPWDLLTADEKAPTLAGIRAVLTALRG